MRCSNGNIHKKSKRATKSPNEQQKAFAWFGFSYSISKTSKSNEEQQKATNDKWKHTPKTKNEQQKATKSIFHSHFHSFAPILDLQKVVDIKSNDGQRKAMKRSRKLRRATKSSNEHRS